MAYAASSIPAIESADALRAAYAAGQRNFSGISLTNATLAGMNLKGVDLSYADLTQANLEAANLRGADLSYAILRGANLCLTNLRGAMLIGTDLRETSMTQADCQKADYDPDSTQFSAGFDPEAAGMKCDRTP